MSVNSEPVYYQLLSAAGTALSAPSGLNLGGDLVNATPDDTSERQMWELVVDPTHPEGDFLRVAMRNKYTGFVAAAPVGDNTWGGDSAGVRPRQCTARSTVDLRGRGRCGLGDSSSWPPKPKSQRDGRRGDWQRSRHRGVSGGREPVEIWTAVRTPH